MALLVKFCKAMDHRFSPSLEYEFRRSLQPKFVTPLYVSSILSIFGSCWILLVHGIDLADSLSVYIFLHNMCRILLGIVAFTVVALRTWIVRRLCYVDLEFVFVVLCSVWLMLSIVGGKWYAAQFFGKDPHQVFGKEASSSEAYVVMLMNLVTIVGCSALPIRSHVQWVFPAVGICMFCAVTIATSSPCPQSFPLLLFLVCAASGYALLGGCRNDSHLRMEWMAQRQIMKQSSISEKQRQGFLHLLNGLCDCLLHLGPNLEIMEPCPNLAAMLFLLDGKALEGSNFCDFIASEEDRSLFIGAMGSETSEEDPARILPLHLRDSHNRGVQVHVYHASFHDQNDSRYHIIGIAEAADFAKPFEEMGVRHKCYTTTERASSASSESGSEASESEITLEPVEGSDLGEISITFDDSAGCSIISCTPGFTGLCGPVGDSLQLIDWIRDKKKFELNVQKVVNTFYSSQHAFGLLVLRPPSAVRAGIEYVMKECTVDAIHLVHGDDPSLERFAVRLRFGDVQQRAARRSSRRKRQTVHVSNSLTSRTGMQLCKM